MSYKGTNNAYLGNSNNHISYEQTGYNEILSTFMKSINELTLEENQLFSKDTAAESACPNLLNGVLSDINENIENNYQCVTDVLTATYNHLAKHGENVEKIETEAQASVSVNYNNGINREEVM